MTLFQNLVRGSNLFLNKTYRNLNFMATKLILSFYLVYKFKKIVGQTDLSDHFRKIIVRYKRIGYNMNVMRHTACLVINTVMANNFADPFNCTPVGRASDLMMLPT